jgi:16S rRNA (uracil1498-N3)-methyltransferase
MRLFIDQTLSIGNSLELDSLSSNYIARVLRLTINDTITCFNGQKPLGEYLAKIVNISKKRVSIQALEFIEKNIESPININLLQGIARGDRMDFTIQKSVELGIHAIYPLILERTNVKLGDHKRQDKKLSHWQAIAHSAMQQSGRTALVKVNNPMTLAAIDAIDADLKLLPDPTANLSLSELIEHTNLLSQPLSKPQNINLLIGPEGGVTDKERDYAKGIGYLPIRLGPRILRTETAGLAIISFLQGSWGDF